MRSALLFVGAGCPPIHAAVPPAFDRASKTRELALRFAALGDNSFELAANDAQLVKYCWQRQSDSGDSRVRDRFGVPLLSGLELGALHAQLLIGFLHNFLRFTSSP